MSVQTIPGRPARRLLIAALALVVIVAASLLAAPASQAKKFDIGFADTLYNSAKRSDPAGGWQSV